MIPPCVWSKSRTSSLHTDHSNFNTSNKTYIQYEIGVNQRNIVILIQHPISYPSPTYVFVSVMFGGLKSLLFWFIFFSCSPFSNLCLVSLQQFIRCCGGLFWFVGNSSNFSIHCFIFLLLSNFFRITIHE